MGVGAECGGRGLQRGLCVPWQPIEKDDESSVPAVGHGEGSSACF